MGYDSIATCREKTVAVELLAILSLKPKEFGLNPDGPTRINELSCLFAYSLLKPHVAFKQGRRGKDGVARKLSWGNLHTLQKKFLDTCVVCLITISLSI